MARLGRYHEGSGHREKAFLFLLACRYDVVLVCTRRLNCRCPLSDPVLSWLVAVDVDEVK